MSTAVRRVGTYALPLLSLALCATAVAAQTPADSTIINESSNPLLASFHFRSIGPASMGGRIDDIEIAPSDQNIIYIGYAVGGVFKSENNGVTFAPVFETYNTASIGDIAIDPTNANIVYVGTGEPNNRQTSSFGDGIYKSTDGGRTFTNVGLRETQTIARIVIDPKNPQVVYVASPGHLFGPNAERGIYKTTDGGKTWSRIKFIDENTGFTDIAIDPSNSNVLYAASYQRRRSGCCFNGGGPGSGLWKTTDAGRTWTKLTGNGLPPGTYGRIAVAVARSNPKVVYAQIEAGVTGTPDTARPPARGRDGRRAPQFDWCNNAGPGGGWPPRRPNDTTTHAVPELDAAKGGVFRSEDAGHTWTLVSNCDARPMYFSQLRVDPTNDKTIYVAGLPVAQSFDGGRTFATLNESGDHADPAHVDQHAIFIDPKNPKHILIGNDGGLDISYDQGRTWDFVNTMATGLAYVVTADTARPYNVYTGLQDNNSWGGPSSKRGRGGITNDDWFGLCGGDGFYTAVNPERPNIVYCESQNGNTSRYDLNTGRQQRIRPSAGPGVVLAGQPAGEAGGAGRGFGRAERRNVINAEPGEEYRFNWNTPVILSSHSPSIVYLGGNRLFKSYDGGDHWVASPDLTKHVDRRTVSLMGVPGDQTQLSKNDGVTHYGTIISVSESPVMPGVVWAGTDDGNLQVSRDGGRTFTEVSSKLPGLPKNNDYWISRIDASHFDAATAYVAVDGHRSDDLAPHVFVTHDYGSTFTSISSDLPSYGDVQVIREDPKNKDLLYVGTEFGLYVSLDAGAHWQKFMNGYPTVRTDDILIHPREGDLIVATHGRSLWIADDITPLQQFTPEVAAEDVHLFDPRPAVAWINDYTNAPHIGGQKVFVGANAPAGTAVSYYLKQPASGDVKITVTDATGRTVAALRGSGAAGINRVQWPAPSGGGRGGFNAEAFAAMTPAQQDSVRTAFENGRGGPTLDPGLYTVTLTVNGRDYVKRAEVLEDRWFKVR